MTTDAENINMQIATEEAIDEPILKPRAPRKPRKPLEPEVKAKLADNMRRINASRIENARLHSEANLKKKEAEIAENAVKKLEVIEKKKNQIKALKESKGISTEQPLDTPKSEPKKEKKTKKQIIIEASDSSTSDSDSESEAEIVYVQKKSKSKKSSDKSITKPKHDNTQKITESKIQEQPKTLIKFI